MDKKDDLMVLNNKELKVLKKAVKILSNEYFTSMWDQSAPAAIENLEYIIEFEDDHRED